MTHLAPPDPWRHEPLWQHESGLTPEELERIRAYGDTLALNPVQLAGKHTEKNVKVGAGRFKLNDETRWVFERMEKVIREANDASYKFDIRGFAEDFYYLRYENPGDHFNWHIDSGPHTEAPRKLSVVLQLSAPSEYEGGDFDVLQAEDKHVRAEKTQGLITVFPPYRVHRVTPVTSGVRRALLMFIHGPDFK